MRDESTIALKEIRDDQNKKEKKIMDDQKEKERNIGEKESQHVDNLRNDPGKQQIIKLMSEQGYTSDRVKALRSDIRETLKENGVVNEKRINRIIDLLIKYPPSDATEKGFRSNKTDPLRRSVDIIKDIKRPH